MIYLVVVHRDIQLGKDVQLICEECFCSAVKCELIFNYNLYFLSFQLYVQFSMYFFFLHVLLHLLSQVLDELEYVDVC